VVTLVTIYSAATGASGIDLAGMVTAFSTAVLAAFTILLVFFTKRLADVTRKPSIVATIEPNQWAMNHMDIHVENEGTASAFEIRLKAEPPVRFERGGRGEKMPFESISILKAGQKVTSYLTSAALVLDQVVSQGVV
jgi:hypothetical protein